MHYEKNSKNSKEIKALIQITKENGLTRLQIKDFFSPKAFISLQEKTNFVQHISDFRRQIKAVFVDFDYNGQFFNVSFYDVPNKKDGMVVGEYTFVQPNPNTKIAVKILDIIGQVILIIK
jgi:hypothetical protein